MLAKCVLVTFFLASSGLAVPIAPVWEDVPVVSDVLEKLHHGHDVKPEDGYGNYRRQISVPVASGGQDDGANPPAGGGTGLIDAAVDTLNGDNNTVLSDIASPSGNEGNGNGNLAGLASGNDVVGGVLNNSTNNVLSGNGDVLSDNSLGGENNTNEVLNDLTVSVLPLGGGGGSLPIGGGNGGAAAPAR